MGSAALRTPRAASLFSAGLSEAPRPFEVCTFHPRSNGLMGERSSARLSHRLRPDEADRNEDYMRGDHIYVRRLGYTHHGVEVDGEQVVHFTGEPARKRDAAIQI